MSLEGLTEGRASTSHSELFQVCSGNDLSPGPRSSIGDDDFNVDTVKECLAITKAENVNVNDSARICIHTDTIPLASNITILLGPGQEVKLSHDNCRCCMYTRNDGSRGECYVGSDCPCQAVSKEETINLCFLDWSKSATMHAVPSGEPLEVEEEMPFFCYNHENIFSDKYHPHVKNGLEGTTGYSGISDLTQLIRLLRMTYWYKRYSVHTKAPVIMRAYIADGGNFFHLRSSVKQAIHTVNGFLIKIMLFSTELSYNEVAEITAELFNGLISDYLLIPDQQLLNSTIAPTYEFLAHWTKMFKEKFHHPEPEVRYSIWHEPFLPSLPKMKEVVARMGESFYNQCLAGYDITDSLQYINIGAVMSQKRSMGYLPYVTARRKLAEYRMLASDQHEMPKEQMALFGKTLEEELKRYIKPNCFNEAIETCKGELYDNLIAEIDCPLKAKADVDYNFLQKGKLQKFQEYAMRLKDRKQKLRIYDLNDLSIKIEFTVTDEYISENGPNIVAYWTSFQIVLNVLTRIAPDRYDRADVYLDLGLKDDEDRLFKTILVAIQEPGKLRLLIKNMAPLTWFHSLTAKALAVVLQEIPGHKVGLLGSSDSWAHTKRVGPASVESGEFWSEDGLRDPDFVTAYADWTMASDFLNRKLGCLKLRILFNWIGFPKSLADMTLTILAQPIEISEVVHEMSREDISSGIDFTTGIESFKLYNGFPMGTPLTKTVLHLTHVTEFGLARYQLRKRGIELVEGFVSPHRNKFLKVVRKRATA